MCLRLLGPNLNVRDKCYCGSGIALKKCKKSGNHHDCYKKFKKVGKDVLRNDLFAYFEPQLLYLEFELNLSVVMALNTMYHRHKARIKG